MAAARKPRLPHPWRGMVGRLAGKTTSGVHSSFTAPSLYRLVGGAIIEVANMGVEIRIIGKGCFFCNELRKIVDDLVAELAIADAQVEQVHNVDELLDYGVVNPPALVVNGKLKMMGRVLVRSRVRRAIEEEMGPPREAHPGESS